MREVDEIRTSERAAKLFRESQATVHVRADRLFANLMVAQWIAGIAAALWISPRTWIGATSETHIHVWASIFIGGALAAFPFYLARRHAGAVLTRHVIAVAQMLTSALLIHLTGGRIETHFHVFGSLAFFAFYRDWRVLVTATLVVAVDHMARGIFWPQSVFGILTPAPWRWMEHAGWVLFEDTFLMISIKQSLRDAFEAATRRAKLELVNASIEEQVAERTTQLTRAHHELQASEQRFRQLSASAPIGIFETDAAGSALYTNQYWQNITGMPLSDSLGEGWRRAVHPDDAPDAFTAWRQSIDEGCEFDGELRFVRRTGEVRWVHIRSAAMRGGNGGVLGHVGTVEDITDRKRAEAELESTHKQLLEASRRAGMAEVATGVLHNVGNVLNSVNVASSCVADGMRNSRIETLSRVVTLLRENESDLGQFFATDQRAKQIPNYLAQFAQYLTAKQEQALQELAHLQRNIDHIKDIVSMQQNYATLSGLTERIPANQLVEDALQMNSSSLAHHNIQLVKELETGPVITVEKHKVLQILVNLIRNAKQACDDSDQVQKRITARVTQDDQQVFLSITDNGVGIPAENLSRIFNHGFTTRRDGHGFGLHSGSLAAKEMGGALRVHSAGPGQGATFTLELPLHVPTERISSSETVFIRRRAAAR